MHHYDIYLLVYVAVNRSLASRRSYAWPPSIRLIDIDRGFASQRHQMLVFGILSGAGRHGYLLPNRWGGLGVNLRVQAAAVPDLGSPLANRSSKA